MTDETDPGHFQSAGSASDDEIGDELALEHGVSDSADVAPDLPTAASPRLRARHSRPRGSDFNLPAFSPLPSDHPTDRPGGVSGGVIAGGAARARRSDRHTKSRKVRRRAPWWELPLLVAVAILIAIVVKTFVVQPFYIPSESMEKTLHGSSQFGHDRILVNKTIYDIRDPHPGDIVVFHAPPGWDEESATKPPSNPVLRVVRGFGQLVGFVPPDGLVLVKRVIAVGGQTVKGVTADGGKSDVVMISDHGPAGPWRTLNEPYVYLPLADPTGTFGPVTVPKGRLWVMGDHRNDSADSRYHCPGTVSTTTTCDPMSSTVPVKDVIGKAVVVAWPPSHWRTLGTPSTFKHAAAAALPSAAGVLGAVPLWLLRRRRRRHGRTDGASADA
ncbi:MAG TPA: signal peptidase I [Jatrophihabitantaceae bacterium]|jgi:signal peptidase I|nr:signal peptidase I [Jatrophihabitantaceae bacterium]